MCNDSLEDGLRVWERGFADKLITHHYLRTKKAKSVKYHDYIAVINSTQRREKTVTVNVEKLLP